MVTAITDVYPWLWNAHWKRQFEFSSYSRVGGVVLLMLYYMLFYCCEMQMLVFIFFFLLWFDLADVDIPVHVVPDGYDRNYFPQLL